MKCAVVVPAAGSGTRFGGEVPKQFAPLLGKPLIAHTVEMLARIDAVDEIVIAVAPDQAEALHEILEREHLTARCRIVEGGETRAESVLRGLAVLEGSPEDSIVAIHDAVRPFVTGALVGRLLEALVGSDGAFPGAAPSDTIHVVEHGVVVETPSRARLVGAQTPQCFRLGVVRRALETALKGGIAVTDEVSAVARLGLRVVAVDGEPDNFKITCREDLERAERLLARKGD